jgi:hypothetical protein
MEQYETNLFAASWLPALAPLASNQQFSTQLPSARSPGGCPAWSPGTRAWGAGSRRIVDSSSLLSLCRTPPCAAGGGRAAAGREKSEENEQMGCDY